ncbi:hypothetical protein J3459_021618 [Metarhizium acridum]|uniref:uncharacterized protein n=1 Tax=Metarhizium acridum TaxID=92637 RepID=UPI001C6B1432|nr:hypothetical protein J3459_021618 [Metarhizium acridum]KAG8405843.1 hypothetical protein J3458_021774 [Metarhizium acridum]
MLGREPPLSDIAKTSKPQNSSCGYYYNSIPSGFSSRIEHPPHADASAKAPDLQIDNTEDVIGPPLACKLLHELLGTRTLSLILMGIELFWLLNLAGSWILHYERRPRILRN